MTFGESGQGIGEVSLNSAGSLDVYLAKYDSNGALLWVKQAGGISNDHGHSVALDSAGNSYVTGRFLRTATFGESGQSIGEVSLNSAGGDDIYLAKYNGNGALLWVKQAGGSADNVGTSVALDSAGNSYITGYSRGTATFGESGQGIGEVSLNSAGDNDIYLAKYNSNGALLWVKQAGGSANSVGTSVALDSAGNSYVTGYFWGTATFGESGQGIGEVSLNSAGSSDIYLAKYNSDGALLWVKQAGGNNQALGNSVALDSAGNSYITGYFVGTATFGESGQGIGEVSLNSAGYFDVYLAKYDSNGALLWVKQAGDNGVSGSSVAIDSNGNAYLTGFFGGTATFGETSLTSTGTNYDAFLAKLLADSSNNKLTIQPDALTINPQEDNTIEVVLSIEATDDLYGLEADISFDAGALTLTDSSFEDYFDPSSRFEIGPNEDAAEGTWDGAITLLNPAPAVTGNGNFARLQFTVADTSATVTIDGTVLFAGISGQAFSSTLVPTTITIDNGINGGTGVITGHKSGATDPSGIYITFLNTDTGGTLTTTTDSNGFFTLSDLRDGNYMLAASNAQHLLGYTTVVISNGETIDVGSLELFLNNDAEDELGAGLLSSFSDLDGDRLANQTESEIGSSSSAFDTVITLSGTGTKSGGDLAIVLIGQGTFTVDEMATASTLSN